MAIPNIHTNVHTFEEVRRALQRLSQFFSEGQLNNLDATVDPAGSNASGTITGSTDDESLGYSAGSLWYNQTNNHFFVCESAEIDNATWQNVTGSSSSIAGNAYETVQGDTGTASATTPTETLDIAGGTGISTAMVAGSPDTITITNTSPHEESEIHVCLLAIDTANEITFTE